MRLYYCDHHEIPLPPGHKFPMRKYRLLRERLLETPERFELLPAPLADLDTVTLIHDASYAQGFLDGTLPAAQWRRIGFPWSPGLVTRTLASVGGTLAAARHALNGGSGIAGGLAGGTHHAFRGEGSGFCIFNDIAVAIAALRRDGVLQRASVIDLDVHQGDGTARIFEDDPDVFTLSVHGRNNFPFRKQVSKLDVELADYTGDDEYLAAVAPALPRAMERNPEIVFFQAGVDALKTDRLGRLGLSHQALERRDEMVLELCRKAGVPLVITLGGGYGDPIEDTVTAHANTFRLAAAYAGGGG